jgi:hypothetical protein
VDALDNGKIGKRRLLALEPVEGGRGESVSDGAQAIRPLRMALAHIVKQAVWMGEKECWHLRVDREPMTPIGQRLGAALKALTFRRSR